MISASIDVIKQDFLYYLKQLDYGQTVLILKENKPIAELKPIRENSLCRMILMSHCRRI